MFCILSKNHMIFFPLDRRELAETVVTVDGTGKITLFVDAKSLIIRIVVRGAQ